MHQKIRLLSCALMVRGFGHSLFIPCCIDTEAVGPWACSSLPNMACPRSGLAHAEDGEGRKATFTFDDTVLPASLKDLPTIVESYKTYDDITLVKTGDIGQVERHSVLTVCPVPFH